MLAKTVNDDAGCLAPRGVLRFFASKLAPTLKGGRDTALDSSQASQLPQNFEIRSTVGAGLPAIAV